MHEFRLTQRVFYSAQGVKARAIADAERLVRGGGHSLVGAMAHRVRAEATSDFDNRERRAWENPFTHEVREVSFADLFEEARACVLPALGAMFSGDFDRKAAAELTGGLNFEGEPVDPDGNFDWQGL